MEKKKTKQHEHPEDTKPTIVEEPFVMYGTLNLDDSKRYTYADYLTWLDDKRRELINGFIHLMSAPNEYHARFTHLALHGLHRFVICVFCIICE